MPKNITIFTRPTCAPCRSLKSYFRRKGIKYNEISVDDPDVLEKINEAGGCSMVPTIVITRQDNTKQIITGFNIRQIASAISY